jgi:DoxX-like family
MNGSSSATQGINTVLLPVSDLATAKVASVAYWTCTALAAFMIASGGLAYALAVPDVVAGIIQLGFPLYFIRMLGVWKVLGGLAIVAPRSPRLKEWAYAGILFDLTGAAVANATMGASIGAEWWHVPAPLIVAALTVGSWALRPPSRRLAGPLL